MTSEGLVQLLQAVLRGDARLDELIAALDAVAQQQPDAALEFMQHVEGLYGRRELRYEIFLKLKDRLAPLMRIPATSIRLAYRQWYLCSDRLSILADPATDPHKGTGAVMCCTFGDASDVSWWYTHKLPLIQAIDSGGCLTEAAGEYAGLTIREARQRIKADLDSKGFQKGRESASQTIRVHERCDTPVEYLVSWQWFIQLLEQKELLRQAGEEVRWYPDHMQGRYSSWVENLNWDWCISRQRFYGVPFPIWYCQECGKVALAGQDQLPVRNTCGKSAWNGRPSCLNPVGSTYRKRPWRWGIRALAISATRFTRPWGAARVCTRWASSCRAAKMSPRGCRLPTRNSNPPKADLAGSR